MNECLLVFCCEDASPTYFYSSTPPKVFPDLTGLGRWPALFSHSTPSFHYHDTHVKLFASFLQGCVLSVWVPSCQVQNLTSRVLSSVTTASSSDFLLNASNMVLCGFNIPTGVFQCQSGCELWLDEAEDITIQRSSPGG